MLKQIVSIRLLQFVLYTVLGLVVLAVAVAILRPPQAAVAAPEAAPNATVLTFGCTPANVAVFATRIHVKCTTSPGSGILYFAAAITDSATSSRYLSLFTSALIAGKTLTIWYYDLPVDGSSWGCATSDCRVLQGAALWP